MCPCSSRPQGQKKAPGVFLGRASTAKTHCGTPLHGATPARDRTDVPQAPNLLHVAESDADERIELSGGQELTAREIPRMVVPWHELPPARQDRIPEATREHEVGQFTARSWRNYPRLFKISTYHRYIGDEEGSVKQPLKESRDVGVEGPRNVDGIEIIPDGAVLVLQRQGRDVYSRIGQILNRNIITSGSYCNLGHSEV